MRVFQNLLTALFLFLTSLACADNNSSSKKTHPESIDYIKPGLMEEKLILSNFQQFYLNTVLPIPDKKEDRKFIADLIQSSQLPPSVKLTNCQSEANQLLKKIDQSSIDALTLFGGIEQLQNSKECWLIQYQSMLSGGVSAFVDKISNQYLLILLSSEG